MSARAALSAGAIPGPAASASRRASSGSAPPHPAPGTPATSRSALLARRQRPGSGSPASSFHSATRTSSSGESSGRGEPRGEFAPQAAQGLGGELVAHDLAVQRVGERDRLPPALAADDDEPRPLELLDRFRPGQVTQLGQRERGDDRQQLEAAARRRRQVPGPDRDQLAKALQPRALAAQAPHAVATGEGPRAIGVGEELADVERVALAELEGAPVDGSVGGTAQAASTSSLTS